MKEQQANKKIRVMIVEDDERIRKSILDFFGKDKEIEICGFFGSGLEVPDEIKFWKPDVIITDFLATDRKGAKVLNVINSDILEKKPKTIVISNTDNISVMEQSFRLGIDYYIKKPIIFSLLKDAILLVCKNNAENTENISRKIRIKNCLKKLGVPVNILGYTYMEEALWYMINSEKTMFLSEIYGKISAKYDTSLKCVEISIRNAIKKAKNTCNDEFKEIFSFCSDPGNSIFLSALKEKIMIEEMSSWDK